MNISPCNFILVTSTPLTSSLIPDKQEQRLVSAIEEGNVSEVQQLLTCGLDPNSKDASGRTMLEVTLGHFTTNTPTPKVGAVCSIISLLIEYGASYTQPLLNEYANIFDYAIAQRNYGLLFSLHKHYNLGISISDQSWEKFFLFGDFEELLLFGEHYPIHLLSKLAQLILQSDKSVVPWLFHKYHLLTQRLKPSIYNPLLLLISPEDTEKILKNDGIGALPAALSHLASGVGNLKCLPVLLRYGAIPLPFLNTALAWNNRPFLLALQKIMGPQILPRPSLHEAIIANDIPRIEKELPTFDLKRQDTLGDTALMTAARFGTVEALHLLFTHIKAEKEIIKQLFCLAEEHKNQAAKRWIVEQYACQYPRTFRRHLLPETFEQSDFLTLQSYVKTIKSSPDTKWILGDLLIDAIFHKDPKIFSFLFDQTDDLSFFYEDIEVYDLYERLSSEFTTAHVEKAIEKFGIPDACFKYLTLWKSLLDHHEPLFNKLLPKLYERATALFNNSNEYFGGYAVTAVCRASIEQIEASLVFNEHNAFSYDLLRIAIKRRKYQVIDLFLKQCPSLLRSFAHLALEEGDEGLIQMLVPHKECLPFAAMYEWSMDPFLLQVIKLQKPEVSPDEREEIAF